jgi:CHAD domain-containing protein
MFTMIKHRLYHNEELDAGVKRVAAALVQGIISDLTSADFDRNVAIHDARKVCKMLRGFLRLVRSAMKDDFCLIDAKFRDASARLSGLRDHDVMAETVHRLRKSDCESISDAELARIRSILVGQSAAAVEIHQNASEQITAFLADMHSILLQIQGWSFRAELGKTGRIGFAKTYRRGLKAMMAAKRLPSDENLHYWRKWVKYHEHHLRLLTKKWKGKAVKRIARLLRLAEALGDDHDLALIQRKLRAHDEVHPSSPRAGLKQFLLAITKRRAKLQSEALKLGKRLYRNRPADLVKKLPGH